MKKAISLMAVIVLLIAFSGCDKYISSYKAIGFVHSNTSADAFMSFFSFDGRMIFKLKSKGEGDLKYSARLDSGKVTVRYDHAGTAEELFSISGGEEIDSHGGYVEAGTVYVIVETDGACRNGELSFSLE